jgi:hypothetical protein
MGTEYTMRPAGVEDTPAILDLVRLSLGNGTTPRETSYWNWKHRDNPFGVSPCLVAEAGGRVIGVRAFMHWGWRSNGSEVRAVRAVDTATHPDWRHKGIFAALTQTLIGQMEHEGVAFVFNTPNGRSRPGYIRMGWESLGRTSLWLRPIRPGKMLRAVMFERNGNGTVCRNFPQSSSIAPARDVLDQPALSAAIQTLSTDRDRLATASTLPYLRWRYANVPGLEYFAASRLDGANSAVAFVRLKGRGRFSELRICDLLLGPTRGALSNARAIVNDMLRDSGCDYASAMAPVRSREAQSLAGCGFLPAPRVGPILTIRPLGQRTAAIPDPLRRSSWHISIGTLELF